MAQSATKKVKLPTKTIEAVAVCSECGEVVCTTKNDLAYRHGFKRYKRRIGSKEFYEFSQEDDKPCAGSSKEVVWKRIK